MIVGRNYREWGFWVGGDFFDWKSYVFGSLADIGARRGCEDRILDSVQDRIRDKLSFRRWKNRQS